MHCWWASWLPDAPYLQSGRSVRSLWTTELSIEEFDHTLHKKRISLIVKRMRLVWIGETFDRFSQRLQPLAQIQGPGQGHIRILSAMVDADCSLDAIQVVDRGYPLEGFSWCVQLLLPSRSIREIVKNP